MMAADEHPKCLGGSVRWANFCIDFGFPKSQCCSGCVTFAESVCIAIDSRDDVLVSAMNAKHSNRATVLNDKKKKFYSKKYVCQQPWKEADGLIVNSAMVAYQKAFIEHHYGIVTERLVQLATVPHRPNRSDWTDPHVVSFAATSNITVTTPLPNTETVATVPTPANPLLDTYANPTVQSPLANPASPVKQPTVEPLIEPTVEPVTEHPTVDSDAVTAEPTAEAVTEKERDINWWTQQYKCQGRWIRTKLSVSYVVIKQEQKTLQEM
jgi:hypothetical protein